ncbi:MAG: hypothetical protein HOP08_18670 [Cyclobacteriaceae bacterium]|nr:hypothetical protein [Cyclobacteriaceae bacterium]
MKHLFVILILFVSINSFAQSTDELDKKGGFKDFKIAEDISTYKDRAKFTKTLDNADTKLFLVKDRVSVKIYTGEVELKVYKEKVAEVIVSFKNSNKDDFEDLVKSLEVLYGESKANKKKSAELDRFEKIQTWSGKTIELRIGYDANRKLSEMVFSGKKNDIDKLKEEF